MTTKVNSTAESQMHDETRVLLGQISTAHGIRGEVIVKSYCDDPKDIAAYGPLSDDTGTRAFKLTIRGTTKRGLIARIDGVDDRNAAEALRRTSLYVDREKLPPPDENEIYHADLIGMAAIDRDGRALGTVVAVQNFGAGDLLEVRPRGKRTTEFYPFDEQFVPDINFDAGTLTIAIDEPADDDAPDNGAARKNSAPNNSSKET